MKEAKELLYSQKLAAEFDKENIPKRQKVS